MAKKFIVTSYPEIRIRSDKDAFPDYPQRCPCCNAGKSPWADHYADKWKGHVYKCGGYYRQVSQIQNHTDVWRGYCPVRKEQNRAENGIICKACGEKNLVGHPGDWDCIFCDTRNPPKEKD